MSWARINAAILDDRNWYKTLPPHPYLVMGIGEFKFALGQIDDTAANGINQSFEVWHCCSVISWSYPGGIGFIPHGKDTVSARRP